MIKVGIVYFSATGATDILAHEIGQGVCSIDDASAEYFRITKDLLAGGRFRGDAVLTGLDTCDAIIFGSPTYMGGVAGQFKAFADSTSELWCQQLWADKLAAGFTCGSAPNGDQSSTLYYFFTLACQHGMLWVSIDSAHGYTCDEVNRLGSQVGVVAHVVGGHVHQTDRKTAKYLGRRVATLCRDTHISSKK